MSSILDRILSAIGDGFARQQSSSDALFASVENNSAKLDQILAILNEAPVNAITGASITLIEGAKNMVQKPHKVAAKATVDFDVLDNGSATGTIAFTDASGETTVPASGATVATSATSSDPGVTVSVDATGLVLTIAPTQPLPNPLPVGVVITATIVITNTDGTSVSITATSQGIDVIAGGPAGASISLA